MTDNKKRGLEDVKTGKCIPLVSIEYLSEVTEVGCTTTINQIYYNNLDVPCEAVYTFPKHPSAAISSLEIFKKDEEGVMQKITGEIKSKKEAREVYSDSIAQGKGSYLLEQSGSELVTLYVGNLPEDHDCKVVLTYLSNISIAEDTIRLAIPLTVAPRCIPLKDLYNKESSGKKIKGLSYGSEDLYRTDIKCNIKTSSCQILKVHSLHHKVNFNRINSAHVDVSLLQERHKDPLAVDFVLEISLAKMDEYPMVINIEGGVSKDSNNQDNYTGVMMSFNPKFYVSQFMEQIKRLQETNPKKREPENVEIIFIVDESGSMSGAPITRVKQALQIFLKSLKLEKTWFNIISFGSSYRSLYKHSCLYTESTMTGAMYYVDTRIKADMGGTEIMAPLQHCVFNTALPQKCRKRAVILLTDGEVSNTDEIINAVSTYAKRSNNVARFFTLGLGANVSHRLVDGVAKSGMGVAEYVSNGNDDVSVKVTRQLKRIMTFVGDAESGLLGELDVQFHASKSNKIVETVPNYLPSYSYEDRIIVYALYNGALNKKDTITVNLAGFKLFTIHLSLGTIELNLTNQVDGKADKEKFDKMQGTKLRQLIAYSAIQQSLLQNYTLDDVIIKRLETLSLKYSILSKFTSFVAVEERTESVSGSMQTIKVPLPTPSGSAQVSLVGSKFSNAYKCTIGADFVTGNILIRPGYNVITQLWDTAGQERYGSLGSNYYRGCDLVFLIYSVESRQTFEKILAWREEVLIQNSVSAHNNPHFCLLGNKTDLLTGSNPFVQKRAVAYEEGRELANMLGIQSFGEISIKEVTGTDVIVKFYEDFMRKTWNEHMGICKAILLGESGVGKTSFSQRYGQMKVDLSDCYIVSNPTGQPAYNSMNSVVSINTNQPPSWWSWMTSWWSNPSPRPFIQEDQDDEEQEETEEDEDQEDDNDNEKKEQQEEEEEDQDDQQVEEEEETSGVRIMKSNLNVKELAMLQKIEGYWEADNSAVLKALGGSSTLKSMIDERAVKSLVELLLGGQTLTDSEKLAKTIWITAVCLECLKEKEEYDLMVQKGMEWIYSQQGVSKRKAKKLFSTARSCLH